MALYPPLWMQEGTYPALLDRWFIQDALGPGPILLSGSGAFQVTQRAAGANMSVDVAPGRALVPGTDNANQGSYTVWSDAPVNVPLAAAPGAGQSRIDSIVVRVRDDFVIGGGNSDFVIIPVQGTAAATGSQVAPTLPTSCMEVGRVLVGPSVSSIVNANITDVRPYARVSTTQLVVSRPLPSLVTGGSPYVVNHNLGTTSVIVDIWDTVTNQRVMANVAIVDANNISVSVTQNAPNPVNVVIMGVSVPATMVLPSNIATTQYVQQQMQQSYSFAVMQTVASPTVAGSPYTLTHNLNTTNLFVEVWDAVTNQLVFTQVNIVDANHISISVAQNMPNSINVVMMGVGNAPLPLAPSNFATKAYVDGKTPTLPAALTTGTTIQSYTDPVGEVWVAKNGVYGGNWYKARDVLLGRAYRNSAYTYPGAGAPMQWNAVSQDVYGMWTPASYGFTAPISGLWRIDSQICIAFTAAAQTASLQSISVRTNILVSAGGNQYVHVHDTYPISANAVITVSAWCSISTLIDPTAALNPSDGYMTVQYIGTG
jgi:hypothetical protein